MDAETKIRIGILAVGLAISAFIGVAPAHGLVARLLDGVGGTTGGTT